MMTMGAGDIVEIKSAAMSAGEGDVADIKWAAMLAAAAHAELGSDPSSGRSSDTGGAA